MRSLMTRKSCAAGMRNAILRNYLKKENLSLFIFYWTPSLGRDFPAEFYQLIAMVRFSSVDVCLDNEINVMSSFWKCSSWK